MQCRASSNLVDDVNSTPERAHRLHDWEDTVLCSGVQWRLTQRVDDIQGALCVQEQQGNTDLCALHCEVQRSAAALKCSQY